MEISFPLNREKMVANIMDNRITGEETKNIWEWRTAERVIGKYFMN